MATKATKEVSVENKSVITETFDKMEEISTNLAESIASDGGTGTGDTPQPGGGGGGNTGGPGGTPPIGPILTMAAPIEDIGAEGTSVEETPAPIEETPAPIEETPAPIEETPAVDTNAPKVSEEIPTSEEILVGDTNAPKVGGEILPADDANAPKDGDKTPPADDANAPKVGDEIPPADDEDESDGEESSIDAVWAEILQIIKQNANYSYISTGRYLKDEVTKFTVKKFHKEFVQGGYAVSESDLRLIELCNTYFGK